MAPDGPVLVMRRDDGAVRVTLNRPERLNSINPELVAGLDEVLDSIAPHDRCLTISGAGRAFCAGGDLAAVLGFADEEPDPATVSAFHDSITRVLRRLELLPIPTIAVVHGYAVAGGLEIAAACDIVLADEEARFGDGHAVNGLLPGGGGSVRLPRILGVARAKYLMLTGRHVSAATMAEWGLVSVVAPSEELPDVVEGLVSDISCRSRLGLARMKALIDAGLDQPIDSALRHEQAITSLHATSVDYREGLRAFAEKRPPLFEQF